MFLDADVVVEESGEEEPGRFLEPRNAVRTGSGAKRARLTGKMHERIEKNGGLLVSSDALVDRLRETGLSMITIDTDKGDDLPDDVKPLTDPSRKPPPPGRLVHYDEEIERATEIRNETTETLKEAMEDVASGKGVDSEKVNAASEVITESVLRNVDAMVSLTRIKKHDPWCMAQESRNINRGQDPRSPRGPQQAGTLRAGRAGSDAQACRLQRRYHA